MKTKPQIAKEEKKRKIKVAWYLIIYFEIESHQDLSSNLLLSLIYLYHSFYLLDFFITDLTFNISTNLILISFIPILLISTQDKHNSVNSNYTLYYSIFHPNFIALNSFRFICLIRFSCFCNCSIQ